MPTPRLALVTFRCRWCGDAWKTTPHRASDLCPDCRQSPRLVAMAGHQTDPRSSECERRLPVDFSSLDIFERDSWTCGICGEGIDPDVCHPEPLSACIDHLVSPPLGEHTQDNVRAAHYACNSRRAKSGDSAPPDIGGRIVKQDLPLDGVAVGDFTADSVIELDNARAKGGRSDGRSHAPGDGAARARIAIRSSPRFPSRRASALGARQNRG